jgi:hypothetical protein
MLKVCASKLAHHDVHSAKLSVLSLLRAGVTDDMLSYACAVLQG